MVLSSRKAFQAYVQEWRIGVLISRLVKAVSHCPLCYQKRTFVGASGTSASTQPGWKGTLPDGVKEYKSPTAIVWVLGRIYCAGTQEDYAAVHKLQDEVSLVPLSAYGKPYTPPPGKVDPSIDMKMAPRDQVNKLDVAAYFQLLAALMKDNPPAAADAPMVAKLAKIGFVPGEDFDIRKLDPAVVKGLEEAPKARKASWPISKKAARTSTGGFS
jgi:hypothetical protein